MSVQENLQSSIWCLTRPKNVSPEAQGTTHLETTLWLSPHKNTSWIRIDKLRIELQERWTSTICFQSCVSSRLHRWIGESVAEIRCSFVEGQRSRFAAQACITSWNCMQKTVSGSHIYIYHTYHTRISWGTYILSLSSIRRSHHWRLHTKHVWCLFRRRLFDIKVLEELHLATAGRGRALMRSSKMGSQWPAKFGFCLYLYFWAIPISSSSPLQKCRFLKMPAAPESPSAQAR